MRLTGKLEAVECNHHRLLFDRAGGGRFRRFKRERWSACLARFPQTVMLHQRRACPRVLSRKKSVHGDFSHAFTRERSSEVRKFAIACAIGKSKESGVRQRRRVRHSSADVFKCLGVPAGLIAIAPYASSRSSILFRGSSSRSDSAPNERPR